MANSRVVIKPSTRHDIEHFYGDKMRDTCRAWSGFYNGDLVSIGGVAITPSLMLVFMEMRSHQEVPDITIWRGTLEIWEKIKNLGYSVLYAVADNNHPNAPAYLDRLGFEQIDYTEHKRVFRWPIQSQ